MKKLFNTLFLVPRHYIDEDIVDTKTLYLFRVKLLQAILLTASLVGLGTGILEILQLLPKDMLYTPIVILYGITNFIAFVLLRKYQYRGYIFAMHFCIFSALATFSVMSVSLVYDEFRLIWFFLLAFASYILGGRWYGLFISLMIVTIILEQFFTDLLHLSVFSIITFTTSLITFNLFAIFFLNKIEQDALMMQKYITKETQKRRTQEQIVKNLSSHKMITLQDDYLWDTHSKILTRHHYTVKLTQKEQRLLTLFIEKNNQCVSFEEIQAHVWAENYEDDISIQSVKFQVTQLRKKLPKACIKNIYGCGYILHL